MKKSLYIYFIFGYIIFALLGLLFIDKISNKLVFDHLVKKEAKTLYDNANIVSYQYNFNNITLDNNNSDFLTLLKTISRTLDSQIWIMNREGEVLVDSTRYYSPNYAIEDFDSVYFGKSYYKIGNFFNHFEDEVLSVYLPVTNEYRTLGYVLLHMPMDIINDEIYYLINNFYLTFAVIFVFSLILLMILTFFVYRPIKKISKASREYAKGNLTYDGLDVKSKDEIGRLASSLKVMASDLNTLKEDQDKFIANVSHDFRSPLTSIKGYIEAMKDGTIPPEMQEKYLDTVLFETERLNKLTASILSLNTGNNGFNYLNYTDFDINIVIKHVIETFEGICLKRKIKFNITFDEKEYIVYADMEKIQQVFYNLIENAIKFSSNMSEIKISVYNKNDKVFVSVKDYGTGIPKESLNKIWDRFYKSDLSRGRDKTGSGLGLSIAKEIINFHNENIDAISTEGVGTEFVFSLQKSKKSLRDYFQS